MNSYAWIVLVALLVGYLLQFIAARLNVLAMPQSPPPEFADIVDIDTCKRSFAYARDKYHLQMFGATTDLVALLVWWWWGGFNTLDIWVRSLALGEIWSGVAYISILILLGNIISIPFSIYGTFVVEERYGFNKTTPKTFILDRIKGLVLAAMLGVPILSAILWFFAYAGSDAWLYCWGATTAFLLLVQYIAPVWLMPLFNRFTPLADGELKQAVLDYTTKAGFTVADIFEVDGSKRSSKANAFFSGFGKNRRIALFDTLIKDYSTEELVAVLAHEVGHQKKRHMIQSLIFGIIHMGVMFYLMSIFISEPGLFAAFQMDMISVYAGLTFFSFLLAPLDMVLGPILKYVSRKNEFEADSFAVQTIPDREPLITALKKLSVDTLSNLTPHPFYVILNHSHPPLIQRIAAIKGVVA
ncbi:MAG: M48 family metallopeptidase [Magnetococcales bacterium]|nr:M48 family metallopeptidase [Magnetococcales bacterium]